MTMKRSKEFYSKVYSNIMTYLMESGMDSRSFSSQIIYGCLSLQNLMLINFGLHETSISHEGEETILCHSEDLFIYF